MLFEHVVAIDESQTHLKSGSALYQKHFAVWLLILYGLQYHLCNRRFGNVENQGLRANLLRLRQEPGHRMISPEIQAFRLPQQQFGPAKVSSVAEPHPEEWTL